MNSKNQLKTFLNNYNIVNPDWDNLPNSFPYCDIRDLNYDERITFNMIKLAWINEHKIDYINTLFGYGVFGSTALLLIIFIFTSVLYYIDIKYKLGLSFLTDFFA